MKNHENLDLSHIAIVMDGNGRWAEKKGLKTEDGHREGVKALLALLKNPEQYSFKYLTIYAFSTENWQRSSGEVSSLMSLMRFYLKKELGNLHKNKVCLRIIGDVSKLDDDLQKSLKLAEEKTKDNDRFFLNVALSYGSKDEIVRAAKWIAQDVEKNKISLNDVSEDLFSQYLYTKDSPDVDLFIRPGGEHRVSNFLLWQSAYAEFYFTDVLWPDFNKQELERAIEDYAKRKRRFGRRDSIHAA